MENNNNRDTVRVSVVFPAYNEAEVLEATINKVIQYLDNLTNSYEIIIAEDGSTDGTNNLA
ncbi:MAG: hypothetical protein AC479_08380, partial [miscellaneous Crenarchaeota group-6 archaeon AD8-1]